MNTDDKISKYENYKDYLLSIGWINKLVTLDQDNKDNIAEFIKIKDIERQPIIDIKFPSGKLITMSPEHTFNLYISDKNGKEITDNTRIRIMKDIPSNIISMLARINYSDVKMSNECHGYKLYCQFTTQYHFQVYMLYNKDEIPRENIKFKFTFDYWTKE